MILPFLYSTSYPVLTGVFQGLWTCGRIRRLCEYVAWWENWKLLKIASKFTNLSFIVNLNLPLRPIHITTPLSSSTTPIYALYAKIHFTHNGIFWLAYDSPFLWLCGATNSRNKIFWFVLLSLKSYECMWMRICMGFSFSSCFCCLKIKVGVRSGKKKGLKL